MPLTIIEKKNHPLSYLKNTNILKWNYKKLLFVILKKKKRNENEKLNQKKIL